MPIHIESGDQPTSLASVKALETKPLGSSEKSVPTLAVTTSLKPRTSRPQVNTTFFPLGDQGFAKYVPQPLDWTRRIDVSVPPANVPSFNFVGSSGDT